jgi:hypothetical protein
MDILIFAILITFKIADRAWLKILVAHEIVLCLTTSSFHWLWMERLADSRFQSCAIPEEYAHYCRYLVARYGARPLYLSL